MSLSLSGDKSYCGSRPIVGQSEDVWRRARAHIAANFHCFERVRLRCRARSCDLRPKRRNSTAPASRGIDGRSERRTDVGATQAEGAEREKMDLFVIFVFHGSPATSSWLTDSVFDFRNFDFPSWNLRRNSIS